METPEGPSTLSPVSGRRLSTTLPRYEAVTYALTRDGGAFATLLRDMQRHASLTTRALARKLGIEPNSINQYLYKKRGRGGTSTLKWFLRFGEACGCRVHLTFPSPEDIRRLEHEPPRAPLILGINGPVETYHDAITDADRSRSIRPDAPVGSPRR